MHSRVATKLTTTIDSPGGPITRRTVWLTIGGIAAFVLGLRLTGLATAYDIFVDEPFYTSMGASVAAGHLPPVNFGKPFLLHPPGFFLIEAAWRALTPVDGNLYHDVILMRLLQQLFAVATAILLFRLIQRLAGFAPAIVATVLFAVDAFVVRQNGRVLLETVTMAFVLAGYLLLTRLAQGQTARRTLTASAAGLLFGAAVLTKDMALLITGVPLAFIAIRATLIRRTEALIAACAPLALYLVWLGYLVVKGYGDEFWTAKTGGLRRLLGTDVITGFNAPDSPSLVGVMWSQGLHFGASYVVVALGTAAGVWLLIRPVHQAERMLGWLAASAAGMTAYNTLFGTIEEHFLYFLQLPALASLVVVGTHLLRGEMTLGPRVTVPVKPIVIAALAVAVTLNMVSWVRTRATPDNGQQLAIQWLQQHAPAGSKVAWIAGQTEYALQGTGLVPLPLGDPALMASNNVSYLVTLEKIIDQGYSFASRSSVDWYAQHSTKVFSFVGRSYGEVAVYQTTDASVW
jgi:4-amino-4-deoxy-L-arabinose transferase-like glycosyltransferase